MSQTASEKLASRLEGKLLSQFKSGAGTTINGLVDDLSPPAEKPDQLKTSLLNSLVHPPTDFPVAIERVKEHSGYSTTKDLCDISSGYDGTLYRRDDQSLHLSLDAKLSVSTTGSYPVSESECSYNGELKLTPRKATQYLKPVTIRADATWFGRQQRWDALCQGAYIKSSAGEGTQ